MRATLKDNFFREKEDVQIECELYLKQFDQDRSALKKYETELLENFTE